MESTQKTQMDHDDEESVKQQILALYARVDPGPFYELAPGITILRTEQGTSGDSN